MIPTLKNNAYHILGLNTSASEREIIKRSKEIISRLKVENIHEYDLDIGNIDDIRTEENVKDALQRLQTPKKRIKEYFFWFQIADSIDEKALSLFKFKDYLNASRTWEYAVDGESIKDLSYKKNLAILYCLILSDEDNKEYLRSSLQLWKDLLGSEKFWHSFVQLYKHHHGQTTSDDIISDFREHVAEYLSDIYTELHQKHKNNDYLNEFQLFFSVKGEKVEKNVLGPAFKAINKTVEDLEALKVSEDGVFDQKEIDLIKHLILKIQGELNNLIDLGLYEDSQTKIMRDRIANSLRSIVLDLHNDLDELHRAEGLLKVSIQICGTESLKSKLQNELTQIQNNIKYNAENYLAINIPGSFNNSTLVFKDNFVMYEGIKILYKDVTVISYNSTVTSHSINGIPTGKTYEYHWNIISGEKDISIDLNSRNDESEAKQNWLKIIGLSSRLIEPHVLKNLIHKLSMGDTLYIGNVEFTNRGYSKIKNKWFGKSEKLNVYWQQVRNKPYFYQGNVILWADGKNSNEFIIPMSANNAVLLPDLVQECCKRREI